MTHSKNCKKIMIVEDDHDIREALREALEMEGYQVQMACNGQEGIEILAKTEAPCLILLDLMMPILDGWEFRKLQKKDDKISAIPVVVISALADKASDLIDANVFIKKPVELDTLIKTVKMFCH